MVICPKGKSNHVSQILYGMPTYEACIIFCVLTNLGRLIIAIGISRGEGESAESSVMDLMPIFYVSDTKE